MNKSIVVLSMAFIGLFITSSYAVADDVIDQTNPYWSASIDGGTLAILEQEVSVGIKGYLNGVDLYWLPDPPSFPSNATLNVFLYKGSGPHTGTGDFHSTVSFTSGNNWNYIDVSSAGLYFNPGDKFVIAVNDYDRYTPLGASYQDAFVDHQYHGGDFFTVWPTRVDTNDSFDLAFRSHMNAPSVTPEPAAKLLFGLGAGVLGLSKRRRKTRDAGREG